MLSGGARLIANHRAHYPGGSERVLSLNIDGETRAGTLIGYLADPLGNHATLRLSEELTAQASEEFRRISLADFLRYCVPGWQT